MEKSYTIVDSITGETYNSVAFVDLEEAKKYVKKHKINIVPKSKLTAILKKFAKYAKTMDDPKEDFWVRNEARLEWNKGINQKIACIECDEVTTKKAWEKNNGTCPKCKVSTQGVSE